MMPEPVLYGGIELGGTKTLMAIGLSDGTIVARATVPTGRPQDLMPALAAFFSEHAASLSSLAGLGVGAFGPIVIDPAADGYGSLLDTNKPGWSGFDLVSALHAVVPAPIRLVTDVAAAGVGEAQLGALRGVDLGLYLTVGTGIGGAIICKGWPLPALLHPEIGHITLRRRSDDREPSTCRFHDSCPEGLAAGPAIIARFGQSLSHFTADGQEYALIADYLGQLCANLVMTLSAHRIVLGGGVCKAPGLIALTHSAMIAHLGGYALGQMAAQDFICKPDLDQDAGIVGALCLWRRSDLLC